MFTSLLLAVIFLVPSPILTVPIVMAAPDPKSAWIDALAQCESEGSTTIKVLDTNHKFSYSVLQFQMATWLKYGKDFGTTKENIYDAGLQKSVARSMLDAGGADNWYNCNNELTKTIGAYPK